MGAFGVMNGVNDTDAMIAANHWCNEYGLDTISAGAAISFATECFEQGLLTKEDTDGIELSWGNATSMMQALHAIGRREGALGELLTDGTTAAAEKIGTGQSLDDLTALGEIGALLGNGKTFWSITI